MNGDALAEAAEKLRYVHAAMQCAAHALDAVRVGVNTGELTPEVIGGALTALRDYMDYLGDMAEQTDDDLEIAQHVMLREVSA